LSGKEDRDRNARPIKNAGTGTGEEDVWSRWEGRLAAAEFQCMK
jgi:uncharacterized protein YijF (DUF1287 family)